VKTTISISPFKPEHTDRIVEMILNIQQKEFNVPVTLADQPDLLEIDTFYQKDKGNFWVALEKDTVVGTIGLIDCDGGIGCIRKMFVRKEYRRHYGIAQILLNILEKQATTHHFKGVYLGTIARLEAAIRFYEKNEFTPILIEDLPSQFPRMAVDTHFFQKIY
jgi:putative acetyltransferase